MDLNDNVETKASDPMDNINEQMQRMTVNDEMQKDEINNANEKSNYTLADLETWEDIQNKLAYVSFQDLKAIASVHEKIGLVDNLTSITSVCEYTDAFKQSTMDQIQCRKHQYFALCWIVAVLTKYGMIDNTSTNLNMIAEDKSFQQWKNVQQQKYRAADGFDQWWTRVGYKFKYMNPCINKIFKICVTKDMESLMKK